MKALDGARIGGYISERIRPLQTRNSRIPLTLLGPELLLPAASEACIVVYWDAWEDSGYVHGSAFVEDTNQIALLGHES